MEKIRSLAEFFRRFISRRRPIVFENSSIPKIVGYFSPIDPFAISFGPWVFCKEKFPERTLRHETIHYHQQLELLFVFQWVMYLAFHTKGLIKEESGEKAYRQNPFELEAYDNDEDPSYLENRELFAWRKYL